MKYFKILLVAVAAMMLAAGTEACKAAKDNKDNITSAQDFASAETEFAGTFDLTDDLGQNDGKIKKGGSSVLPSGAVLTWIDSLFTDGDGVEFNIDFGAMGSSVPKGLLCGDGKYRAGKIHYSLSKRYSQIGAVFTVQADAADLFFTGDGTNMFQLSGAQSITRSDIDSLDISVTNGKLTDPDGKTFTFQGNKTIKVLTGLLTPGIWGDSYRIKGSGGGTNRDGDAYTWSILTPLIKKMEVGCAKTFIAGVIEVKNTTANTSIKVDFDPYNNQACDRVAKAIIGTKEIIFIVK